MLDAMKSLLDRDTHWADWARKAGYRARTLARLRGVSQRHLERYFIDYFGRPTQEWLDELRLVKAAVLLTRGSTVKETAGELGFECVSHFSRKFARYHGCRPSQLIQIHDRRRQERQRQFESWFPGEPVPDEWLADPALNKPWDLLLQQSRRIPLVRSTNR